MTSHSPRRVIRLVFAFGLLVAGAQLGFLVAWAVFSNPSTSQTNAFAAGSLPQGSTPTASVTPANSPTVSISFSTVNTSGGSQITTYAVIRYNGTTNVLVGAISGTC